MYGGHSNERSIAKSEKERALRKRRRQSLEKETQIKKAMDEPLVLAGSKWAVPKEGFLSETTRAQYTAATVIYDAIFEDAVRVAEQEIYAIEDWPTSKAVVASRVMAAIRRLKLS